MAANANKKVAKETGWFEYCVRPMIMALVEFCGYFILKNYQFSVLITVVISFEKTPQIRLWTLHVWKWILISGANVGIVVVLGLGHREVMLESRLHEFAHCMFFFFPCRSSCVTCCLIYIHLVNLILSEDEDAAACAASSKSVAASRNVTATLSDQVFDAVRMLRIV